MSYCCNGIYRVEAVGLKKFQLYFKNYNICEFGKLGAISWKTDILPINDSNLILTTISHYSGYLLHSKLCFDQGEF